LVQHGPVHRGLNVIVVTVILLALLGMSVPVAWRLFGRIEIQAIGATTSAAESALAA